jgi:hypothetical protein
VLKILNFSPRKNPSKPARRLMWVLQKWRE